MRNISFMLTQEQVRSRTKRVTRRMGWRHLKAGDLLSGVEKGMGLKPGEKVVKIATIRVVAVRQELLRRLVDEPAYGAEECRLEGFGEHPTLRDPTAFVAFFCASHRGCTAASAVTRIEFEYLE